MTGIDVTDERYMSLAWKQVKDDCDLHGLTVNELANYHAFFVWGWNYRSQLEKQMREAGTQHQSEGYSSGGARRGGVMDTGKLPPDAYYACREIVAERDRLRAENEALRKDAERYRWLRIWRNAALFCEQSPWTEHDTVDEAIDALRGEVK